MSADEILDSTKQTSISAFGIVKQSIGVIIKHPQLLLYPFGSLIFIYLTYPIIKGSFIADWYDRVFNQAGTIAPHDVSLVIGLVTFYAFYTAFISAYFTTAVSAAVLDTLDGKKPRIFSGLTQVIRHFGRVTKFAILSVFLFPMGIYAQRRKLPRGIIGILGSSFTLHMAQIAPSILNGKQKYGETIRDSIENLGKSWKEGLILKIGMYTAIFLVLVLPKLLEHRWYKDNTVNDFNWIAGIMVGASGFVFFKVINAIFTAVMYHKAVNSRQG